jgi:hypothetical protein
MRLKKFIQEAVHKEFMRCIQEDTSDGVFSMQQLNACHSLEEAFDYLTRTLKYLNEGMYRATFLLDKTRVIKIALPQADDNQNAQELENSKCLPKNYVVQVVDHHPDFWWIIEEKLTPMNEVEFVSKFLSVTGQEDLEMEYDMDDQAISSSIELGVYGTVFSENKLKIVKYHRAFSQSPWYMGLIKALKKCQVSSADFHAGNWGIRPTTGELVILDLGF